MTDSNIQGVNDPLQAFLKQGYLIADFYDDVQITMAEELIRERIETSRENIGAVARDPDWKLADYHEALGHDKALHGRLMEAPSRFITLNDTMLAPIHQAPMRTFFDYFWDRQEPLITHWGYGADRELRPDNACGFRCVRPGTGDITGAHVDTYYGYGVKPEDGMNALANRVYKSVDQLDLITAWVPIIGYDDRFSLRFAPRSHLVHHPIEAFKQSPNFITRACTDEYESGFTFIRPTLRRGQAIIFHPNLLHGGSANMGDITRVSLEIRFRNPALLQAA